MTEQGLTVIGSQPVADFSVRAVKARVKAMHDLMKDVMEEGVHFGTIPGTPRPTLYKPGAEKIGLLFQLAPSFKRQLIHDGEHLTVISECTLTHMPSGTVVAQAGGMCSSKESKYAFRKATRKCPKCGKDAIIKGKVEYGGGWVCFDRKGGCKAKFKDGDKTIEDQIEGQEENPNLADTHNTILKMADKRAYVAATLFGTAASDIYTQDVEDFAEPPPPEPETPRKATPKHAQDATTPHSAVTDTMKQLDEAAQGGFTALAALWKANARGWRERFTDDAFTLIEAHKEDLKASLDQAPEMGA